MYECTQKRNEYELRLKQYKEGREFAKLSGNTELADRYNTKYVNMRNNYKVFCNNCGLTTRLQNLKIYI
jgi:hypothetical protein